MSTTMTVAEKEHVELSPSSSSRWLACPGSIEAERGLPDTDSIHSREGTAAHALAEVAFQRDRAPELWVGESVEGIVVTQDMADHVETYVDALRDYSEGAEIVRVERKLYLPRSMRPPAEMGGTCDAWFYYPATHKLRVVDLKYGKGVVVEAEGDEGEPNPQLAYYAVLAWLDLYAESRAKAERVTEIELVVLQPRAFHPEGPVRTTTLTLAELKDFALNLILGARAAMAQGAPRRAGKHCVFCKAKLTCDEFRGKALAVAQVRFDDLLEDAPLELASPVGLTPTELGRVMRGAETLKAWIDTVRSTVMGELEAGRPVPGFALKPKRAMRKWRDEKAVIEWAKSAKIRKAEIMEPAAVKSPAQLGMRLKKLGVALPEELVVRESSGYNLTSDDDPKAVVPQGIEALEEAPASVTNQLKESTK